MTCGPQDFNTPKTYYQELGCLNNLICYTTPTCLGAWVNTPWTLKVTGKMSEGHIELSKRYRIFVFQTGGDASNPNHKFVACREGSVGYFDYDIEEDFVMPLIDRIVTYSVYLQIYDYHMSAWADWHDCELMWIKFWPAEGVPPESCYWGETCVTEGCPEGQFCDTRLTPPICMPVGNDWGDWLSDHKNWVIGGLAITVLLSAAPLIMKKK